MTAPRFAEFALKIFPFLDLERFHERYYEVLEAFARGRIRRLIVSMPPQHGKSMGASVLLPAYILGLSPDSRVAIASYSSTLANRFNRRVQRILESREYGEIFPDTRIKAPGERSSYVRTADQAEIIGRNGELLSVGREGSLTGNRVDIFILDDLYKDAMEANSPVIRENCWEWYTSVVRTRMHNDSSELIVFTRWHDEDLVGMISARERVTPLLDTAQIAAARPDEWLLLNFEAVKESPPSPIDPRTAGEALWENRQSAALLREKRRLDPLRFECMYQGRPSSREGLLYGDNLATYSQLPGTIIRTANYTDTADTGDDYLCSICYAVGGDGLIYITDAVYSREGMEITEKAVAEMLRRNQTSRALVESNNGGRGFARAVARLAPATRMEWFHQSANKEARILSHSATVLHNVLMPEGWRVRWPEMYAHLTAYRRQFRSNRWHDAADVLTGIVEHEITSPDNRRIHAVGWGG